MKGGETAPVESCAGGSKMSYWHESVRLRGPILFCGTLGWILYPFVTIAIHALNEAVTARAIVTVVALSLGLYWTLQDGVTFAKRSGRRFVRQVVQRVDEQQWVLDDILISIAEGWMNSVTTFSALFTTTYAALPLQQDQRVRLVQSCFEEEQQHLVQEIFTRPSGILRIPELLHNDDPDSNVSSQQHALDHELLGAIDPRGRAVLETDLDWDNDDENGMIFPGEDDDDDTDESDVRTEDTTKSDHEHRENSPDTPVRDRTRNLPSRHATRGSGMQHSTPFPRHGVRSGASPVPPTIKSPNEALASILKEKFQEWAAHYTSEKRNELLMLVPDSTWQGVALVSIVTLLVQLRMSGTARKTAWKALLGTTTVTLMGVATSSISALAAKHCIMNYFSSYANNSSEEGPSLRSRSGSIGTPRANQRTQLAKKAFNVWKWLLEIIKNKQNIKGAIAVFVLMYMRKQRTTGRLPPGMTYAR
uniref:Uncharacterized protein n=1 Tax=Attheya septentrionalis TaxID=420275 RepID=A0A7S2XPG1_9STRA|mmetsp:Transcript_18194/g.32982  ORF Transcript_18194/g.32982 Transcript_18194/m.32982 type:complete len:476 (+) Transcript_18194:261-1688(+)